MREILFRGKRVDNGSWVYGDFTKPCNIVWIEEDERQNNDLVIFDEKVQEETLGQYTGLTDKNGTKIFEGDLLYFRNSNHDEENGAMEVIFEDGAFMISGDILVPLHETYSWELEVIGNIYDNPELLEGDK